VAGAVRQYRMRIVRSHGTHGFLSCAHHGSEQKLDVFLGITKGLLTIQQGGCIRRHGIYGRWQLIQGDLGLVQPFPVGMGVSQLVLQLSIIDNSSLLHIDEEHLARLQTPFFDNLAFRDIQHTHL